MSAEKEPKRSITEEEERALAALKNEACFFTGHRSIPSTLVRPLNELLQKEVESLIYQGYRVFLCGSARGFDLMAASAVLQQKRLHPSLRLILALPCPNQTRGWPEPDVLLYETVCRFGEPYLISDAYDPACMQRRNYFLVDHAVTGVAFYREKKYSGTAQTLRYAERKNIPVINLASLLPDPDSAGTDRKKL